MELEELYKATLDGNPETQERLFCALSARFRVLARHRIKNVQDAEDVVQESLMAAARDYKGIVVQTSFPAWAHKILHNRVIAYFERKSTIRNRTADLDDETMNLPDLKSEIEPGFRLNLLECLRQVARANIRYARILNFHHLGYETEDICGKLLLTRSNFYSILSRARSLLEGCLEDKQNG
jgi:DNA-directed RNA polymerase specialized sigma24 family protein